MMEKEGRGVAAVTHAAGIDGPADHAHQERRHRLVDFKNTFKGYAQIA